MGLGIAADLDVEVVAVHAADEGDQVAGVAELARVSHPRRQVAAQRDEASAAHGLVALQQRRDLGARAADAGNVRRRVRSEEQTSELQSLMRISYAVYCLQKKKHTNSHNQVPYNKVVIRG